MNFDFDRDQRSKHRGPSLYYLVGRWYFKLILNVCVKYHIMKTYLMRNHGYCTYTENKNFSIVANIQVSKGSGIDRDYCTYIKNKNNTKRKSM
jgi:hypothetical protein